MLDTLRKRQRTLLIIITGVTIITFVVFLNPSTRMRGGPGGEIGKINGRSVTVEDVQKLYNIPGLAYGLGLTDFVQRLIPADARTQDEQNLGFAWNLLLLRDEAKALQTDPPDDVIRNAEKNLPVFQTDGHFDQEKYQKFTVIASMRGFTPADIDNVVADSLRVENVFHLVTAAGEYLLSGS